MSVPRYTLRGGEGDREREGGKEEREGGEGGEGGEALCDYSATHRGGRWERDGREGGEGGEEGMEEWKQRGRKGWGMRGKAPHHTIT